MSANTLAERQASRRQCRREPRFVGEFAEVLAEIGEVVFTRRFTRGVLVGYGIVADISERPFRWERRTLPIDDLAEIAAVQSILDRVWPICKDPGSVRGSRIFLGASAECDVVVPDYSISTRHCAFSFEPGRMLIADMRSLNGTRLAGQRIMAGDPVPVRDRVPILVGRVKMQFLTRESFFELVRRRLHQQV